MFRVDYTVPSTGREYGAIFLNQENIAHMLVREGWADVREIRSSDAENVDVEALYSYKAEAQAAKRGIWADSSSVSVYSFTERNQRGRSLQEEDTPPPFAQRRGMY